MNNTFRNSIIMHTSWISSKDWNNSLVVSYHAESPWAYASLGWVSRIAKESNSWNQGLSRSYQG